MFRSLSKTAVVVALACAACATKSSGSPASVTSPTPTATATPTQGTPFSGQLVGGSGARPGAIAGVAWRTPSLSGVTDAAGTFHWNAGESVTFRIADVDLVAAPGAPMLSPWQLAANGACASSADLRRLLVLLWSLDADGDPSNGIALPPTQPGPTQRALASLSDADVAALIAQVIPGRTPVDATAALDAFAGQMDAESWQPLGADEFYGTTGLVRSQGLATDGTSWFFSWELGLERTAADFTDELNQTPAIPSALAALGDNHIGDVDFWNGSLYAPIEDGSAYLHPYVAVFDPTTLVAGQTFALPATALTEGVPWVAVDGPHGRFLAAQWDPTPEILFFDLATGAPAGSLPIRPTLSRIQGAKIHDGALYAATNDANNEVYKIDLDTGTVIPLFSTGSGFEQEGLAFRDLPDGSSMHTLNVRADKLGSELRHQQLVTPALRTLVCP